MTNTDTTPTEALINAAATVSTMPEFSHIESPLILAICEAYERTRPTPQPEAIDTNTAICNHSPQQHIQTDSVEKIREALEEIREIWAGAEYGKPVYAQEAYVMRLCKQMYDEAIKALALLPTLTAAPEPERAKQSNLLALLESPEVVEVAYEGFVKQLKKDGWTACDSAYVPAEKRALSAALAAITSFIKGDARRSSTAEQRSSVGTGESPAGLASKALEPSPTSYAGEE